MPRCAAIVPALLLLATAGAGESLLPDGKAMAFQGDLGERRANWTTCAWTAVAYPQTRNAAGAGVAITVTTDKPRGDVEMYLAFREADGSWLYHPRACPLSAGSNTATVRFADFVPAEWVAPAIDGKGGSHADEDGSLNPSEITAVAVGTVNPFGVGPVSFTVTALDVVPPLPQTAPTPAALRVTGRLLDVCGTTTVPAGLFGGFYLPKGTHERHRFAMNRTIGNLDGRPPLGSGTTHLHVLTHGDRGASSPLADRPGDYGPKLAADAKAAGEAAKAAGRRLYVEFWNEPYLNWSNKNRVMFKPEYFDQSKAAEGAEVLLKDGSPCPFLKWTRRFEVPPWNWVGSRYTADGRDNWRRGIDGKGNLTSQLYVPTPWSRNKTYNAALHPPKDVKDGEKYTATVKEKGKENTLELTATTPWWIYDETQFTFWSAKGMARFYNEPMRIAGEAIKAADPSATYIVGWCSRPTEDHFAAFDLAYRDTIDAAGTLADGVNDHDYGGDPLRMLASAELVTAYGMTRLGKRLTSWNTECSASADPEAYAGAAGQPDPKAANLVKYRWALRKLVSAIALQPDKMRSFAFFGDADKPPKSYYSPDGDGVAFDLLNTLRGRLVESQGTGDGLYIASSIDGTDAENPRPAAFPQRKELVVAVLNGRASARPVQVAIDAPAGTAFAGAMVRHGVGADGAPKLSEEDGKCPAGAKAWTFTGEIAPLDAVVLVLPLQGEPGSAAEAVRLDAFAKDVVARVLPGKPLATTVALDGDRLALARRPGAQAALRLVLENAAAKELVAVVAGREIAVPAVVAGDNAPQLVELPVDATALAATTPVEIRVADPGRQFGVNVGCVTLTISGPAR